MRILVVTDAWRPQVNGVVRSLEQLEVEARRMGDSLQISVIDNGRGLPAQPPQRTGIGVANTRERLRERFGANSGAGLVMDSPAGGGTAAILTLPLSATATAVISRP